MPNRLQAKATKIAEEITGKRFCNNCFVHQVIDGGMWTLSANGLRRKWKCAGCIQRQKQRQKQRLQTVSK